MAAKAPGRATMTPTLSADPVATAVQLRGRMLSLAGGHDEAFEMIFYFLGSNHRLATIVHGARKRRSFLTMLLADLAWVHGDRDAHDGTPPPTAEQRGRTLRRTDTLVRPVRQQGGDT